jgi:predicted phosphodiesterase
MNFFKELIPPARRNGWSEEEIEIVIGMRGSSYKAISSALKMNGYDRKPEAIRSYVRRKGLFRQPKQQTKSEVKQLIYRSHLLPEEEQYVNTIEEIETLRERLIDLNRSKYKNIGRPTKKTNIKVLSLSDLHIPFENTDTIAHALKKHSDADILVINGDFLELYAVSTWPKNKNVVLKWEYQIAIEWLKLFSKTFKKVVLTSGNHEARLKSYFAAKIDPSISFLVGNDILSRLAQGEDFWGENRESLTAEMHDFSNVEYQPGLLSWYTKIGKCIFAHPRSFSKVPAKTAVNTADYFLGREDYQAVVIGHTHKLSKLIWKDKLLMESGCCCVPMDYEADGKMKYTPQAFGYAVVYMDEDGNVDFNKSNAIYTGTAFITKQSLED